MKTFTDNAQTQTDKKLEVEPITILEIEWDSGTQYYADKEFILSGITYQGKLLSFSPLNTQITQNSVSEISVVSAELDDTDSTIKSIINTDVIEGTSVVVYQYFEGLTRSDFITLFKGKILGDINWSEGERIFSFSIQTYILNKEVGYAPTDQDCIDYGFAGDMEGVPWPIIFGSVKKFPLPQVKKHAYAILAEDLHTGYNEGSIGYFLLENPSDFVRGASNYYYVDILPKEDSNELFTPAGANGRIRFYGYLADTTDVFYVAEENCSIYTDLAVGVRDYDDYDGNNAHVIWLYSRENIEGLFCWYQPVSGQDGFINRCIKQVGNKCWFEKPWKSAENSVDNKFLTYGDLITDVAGAPRSSWPNDYSIMTIIQEQTNTWASNTAYSLGNHRIPTSPNDFIYEAIVAGVSSATEPSWPTLIGSTVVDGTVTWICIGASVGTHLAIIRLTYKRDVYAFEVGCEVIANAGTNDIYVVNLIPGSTLTNIWAEKQIHGKKYLVKLTECVEANGESHLGLFVWKQNQSLGGRKVDYVEVPGQIDLRRLRGEDFTGKLFGTVTSTIGPNVADIIDWLVNEYTDQNGIHPDSWQSCLIDLEDYPANFAVLDQPTVLDLCADIAWQSRCAFVIREGVFHLKYLSKIPTEYPTIGEDRTQFKTIDLGFSISEDIITRIKATWFSDWSGYESAQKLFTYKNNIETYGLINLDKTFFIYDNETLVKYSAGFWGYRYSNSWRNINFNSFLNALRLEVFDPAAINLAIVSENQLRGEIKSLSHDSDNHLVSLQMEIAAKTGDVDSSQQPQEDTGYWTGDPSYSIPGVSAPETSPTRHVNILLAFLSPNEGTYYYPSNPNAGRIVWNSDHALFKTEYDSLIENYGDAHISGGVCLIIDGPLAPPAGFGFWDWKTVKEASQAVGAHTPGGIANYDAIELYSVASTPNLNDLKAAFLAMGGFEYVTITVKIFKSPITDQATFYNSGTVYAQFVAWLQGLGLGITVNEYNVGDWTGCNNYQWIKAMAYHLGEL